MSKAQKYNQTKVSFGSVNPLFEAELAKILHYGQIKYDKFNYAQKGLSLEDYYSAARRHLTKMALGEWTDPESGCSHVGHVAACMLMAFTAVQLGHVNPEEGVFNPLAGKECCSALTLVPQIVEQMEKLHKKNFKEGESCQDEEEKWIQGYNEWKDTASTSTDSDPSKLDSLMEEMSKSPSESLSETTDSLESELASKMLIEELWSL